MTRQEILERERRWQLPAAIGAMAGVAVSIAAGVASAGAVGTDSDAERLADRAAESGALLISSLLSASGFLLLIVPILFLFIATRARTPGMVGSLGYLFAFGAVMLAANSIITWSELNAAADEFVAGGPTEGEDADERARELREDAIRGLPTGLGFAGALGFAVGIFYTAMTSMRVGLMTRFSGTFGMAAAFTVLLPFLLPFLLFWFVIVGMTIAGWWPGGRLPAWEAGEARPWPKPGEKAGRGEEPPEVEYPGEFPDDPAQPPAGPPGSGDGSGDGAGEPGQAPRKRKRRR